MVTCLCLIIVTLYNLVETVVHTVVVNLEAALLSFVHALVLVSLDKQVPSSHFSIIEFLQLLFRLPVFG